MKSISKLSMAFAISIYVIFCSGCQVKQAYVLKNDQIDFITRNDIEKITDSICTAIASKNTAYLYRISYGEMKNLLPKYDTLLQRVSIVKKDYPVYDQFLVSNSELLFGNNLLPSSKNTYNYYYAPSSGIGYLYVTPLKSINPLLDWLLVCSFYKENNSWKLTSIYMGPYKNREKTTFDYFSAYNDCYEKGNYLDAFINLQMTMSLLQPSPFCHPVNEKEVTLARHKMDSVFKGGLFPLKLNKLGLTEIESIYTVLYNGQIYPVVKYKTLVSMDDSNAIKIEGRDIRKMLNERTSLLAEINDSTVYIACDQNFGAKMGQNYRMFTYWGPSK